MNTEWKYLIDVAHKEDAPQWVKTLAQAIGPIRGACYYGDKEADRRMALHVIELTRDALELAEIELLGVQ